MPLNSMHMYEPRLHIVRVNVIPGQGLEAVSVMSHRLRVTGFVAVTAYQNDKVRLAERGLWGGDGGICSGVFSYRFA